MKSCVACRHNFDQAAWTCPQCSFQPLEVDCFVSFAPDLADQCDGFEAKEFEKLFQLEKDSFWFRSRSKLINWGIGKYFPQAKHLLEVGCGTGYVLSGIAEHRKDLRLYGTDILVDGLKYAKGRVPKASFWQMDARNMPFFDEFDIICAFDVIEHIKEDDIVLREFFKALRPGGGILLTVPQHMLLWSVRDEEAHHVRRYEARELTKRVEEAGFRITAVTSFVSLLLPALLISRSRQNSTKRFDVEGEYRQAARFGTALEAIMDVELKAIKIGMQFPVGGSLFLAAYKD